ncbi:MAG: DUF11 domain-containing protein, partial [Candidatus Eisenbacteria bacterium]|nr:DUF11 domain-containing protein [Candidatus Eisenbacteria bacterium]
PDEGDTITYTLTVVNNGPARATGVSLTDPLPTGVTYTSHSGDGSYDSGTGVWTVGTLDNGESAVLHIVGTVDAGTAGTVITNAIVDVSLDQDDSDVTEDDLDEDIAVGDDTDLAVTKTVDDQSPIEGRNVVFTITVMNNGPAEATGVSLTDLMPDGVTYVSDTGDGSYDSDTGVWGIGALEAGESMSLSIEVTVDAGTSGTTITNEISDVSLDQNDTNETEDDLSEDLYPGDIGLMKTASVKRTTVGGMIPYVLTAENKSDSDQMGVRFEDLVPVGFSLVEDSASLIRTGPDGEFGTPDDVRDSMAVSGTRPLVFGPIDLAGSEVVRITYVLRAGAGVIPGEHENTAIPYVGDQPAGKEARATVMLEADAMLDKSTIVGKVFHDRDGDGWQDPAGATGVTIAGGAADGLFVPGTTTIDRGDGPTTMAGGSPLADGIELGDLAPLDDASGVSRIVIRAELTRPEMPDVSIRSKEGTRSVLHADGTITSEHVGVVADGFNGQNIVVKPEIISTPIEAGPEGEWTTETRTVVEVDTIKLRDVVSPIYFESGKSNISTEHIEALRKVIDELSGKDNVRLHIVGHTDSQRLSARASAIYGDNHGLGLSRAQEVGKLLAEALGLPQDAVSAESMGPDEPAASNDTPEGMAKNRRAEVEVWYDEAVAHERLVTDDVYVEHEAEPQAKHELVITVANMGACEEGIAGARLATTDGLVVETDALGRYHLADIDGGRFDRGGLVAIKADAAYLPVGAVFTTDNPRVIRVTPGMIEKIDFGVKLPGRKGGAAITSEPAGASMTQRVELTSGELPLSLGAMGEDGRPWKPGLRVLPDDYFFMVGMANVTVGQNDVSGSTDLLADDYHYNDDMFTDGRVALYMKSRLNGRLLLTAQMDTEEGDLEHLFDNFDRTDPRSVFRKLDPDRFYPTYGDDSVTFLDTESQGRFYVRADWDRSKLMWGNYNTDFTGTEYARYNRSLYGAMGRLESVAETNRGQSRVDLAAFGSEPQTAFAHVEFEATGGSLYYLKHEDIVQGSEKLWVEIRDRDSGRLVERVTLERARDYEIDEIQGRAILARPLTQVADQAEPSIIKDVPLDGNRVFLLADYEYVPDGFDADNLTYGGRGKAWLTDGVAVGGTYVQEDGEVTDYKLSGADVTMTLGEGTYLKGEYASSEAARSGDQYVSDDGGLSFDRVNAAPDTLDLKGEAWSVEGRVALPGKADDAAGDAVGVWWKRRDAGFAMPGLERGTEITQYGGEVQVHVGSVLGLSGRAAVAEREGVGTDQRYSAQADLAVTDRLSFGVEARRLTNKPDWGKETNSTLGGTRIGYDVTRSVNVYGVGQFMLDKTDDVPDNNLGTLGVRGRIGEKLALKAEASTGDLGTAANIGANYALDDLHTMYGTYTLSPDHTGGEKGVYTLGQRKTVSDQLKVFTEHQFSQSNIAAEITQVYGLDYSMTEWTTIGLSVQSSDLEDDEASSDRDVASLYASYGRGKTRAGAKLEYRRDSGAAEREQWLTTNTLNYRATEGLTLQGKFSFSSTTDESAEAASGSDDETASFVEAGVGFAYRPICGGRSNVLGRYTYLQDLPGTCQTPEYGIEQRAHLMELEGIHALGHRLDLGGKIARKQGELRFESEDGDWYSTEVNFAAARARYHIVKAWDTMLEYRWLNVKETEDTRQGVLAGVYRQIGGNLRIGVGYNFTDFTDDLTDLSYESRGWFIDVTGSY